MVIVESLRNALKRAECNDLDIHVAEMTRRYGMSRTTPSKCVGVVTPSKAKTGKPDQVDTAFKLNVAHKRRRQIMCGSQEVIIAAENIISLEIR